MTDATAASRYFLPWVRSGLAARIVGPAVLGKIADPGAGKTSIPSRAQVAVTLRLVGDGSVEHTPPTSDDIAAPNTLYGPGDVVGIDQREIVRTEPRHLTMDFPSNLFPFIEFDRPDFPWMFTPAAADGAGCLRPWVVLVVVRKEAARFTADPRRPLPTLECPVAELPDLTESWAWVHAQYSGGPSDAVPGALASKPQQAISRLLCPRRLDASAGYIACLVPAFEIGRKAGLGESLGASDDRIEPAWTLTAGGQAVLPTYYHWEFGTGAAGDFEDLVDRLQVLDGLPGVAPPLMNVSRPAANMSYRDATLGIETVLRAPGTDSVGWPSNLEKTFQEFQLQLQQILEAPEKQTTATPASLAPPVYGRWHAQASAGSGGSPGMPSLSTAGWFRDLNLDPRYRVAAALGTQIVQRDQEQLVAAAWEQVTQIEAVNQLLRQKQLAQSVTASIHGNRIGKLREDAFSQITAPVAVPVTASSLPSMPTMVAGAGGAQVPAGQIAQAALSASYRRAARSLTPRMPTGGAAPLPPTATPTAGLTGLFDRIAAGLVPVAPAPGVVRSGADVAGAPLPTSTGPVRAAAVAAQYKTALLQRLDPSKTFTTEARARVTVPTDMAGLWDRSDPLQPVSVAPSFPQPMYEPLQEMFQQMLLPNLERVPNNSVTLLEANPKFIEAYMVGLNHELSRELLWREFPTNLGATYFRQLWDMRGLLSAAADPGASFDIPPIDQWGGALGDNMPAARGKNLFLLLIRGDLLTRYPTALVYAARAKWSPDGTPVVDEAQLAQFPMMRVEPAPGVTLLGFMLTPSPRASDAPSGDPGWFFVIEEQPTELRFGLDFTRDQQSLTSWRELSWDDVSKRTDGSGYISMAPAPQVSDQRASWGTNGAHMAYITLQQPYRLQIHAARWFPGAADNAKFVSQKLPDTMVAGQRYDVEIIMRNTGLNPWTIGGPNPYRLGSQNPQDNVDWGLRRVDVPSEVPAGATATFHFTITAPSARTHQFQWRMLREGVQWFGESSPAVTVSYLSNAAFVRQSVPATMIAGQSYSVSVTMRNAGTSLWTSGGSNPFRLGSQNPPENTVWGLSRGELPGPVPPGAEVTFAFNVTAPAAGLRHFQWRMLQELVEWFGELSSDVAVNVIPPPALTVSASPSTIRENISTTLTISCKDSSTGAIVAGRVWVAGVDTAATDQAFTRKYNGAEQITVRAAGYPETKVNVQFSTSPF